MATGSVCSFLLPSLPVLLLLKQLFAQAASDHHPTNTTTPTTVITTAQEPCRFVCWDASCLPSLVLVCDGHSHCSDGGDEVDCPSLLLLHLGTAPKPPSHLQPPPGRHPPSNSASVVVHRGTTVAATRPHEHHHLHDVSHPSAVQIIVIIISALFVVGVITCILSHHTMGARSWSDQRNQAPQPHSARMQLQLPCPQHLQPQQPPYTYTLTSTTTSIMYSPATVQERQRLEAEAFHDHLVQIQSVQTDLMLDLPHSIALPDGEMIHHCSAAKHLKTENSEHHGEITRNFIRPPPNRTVYEVDSFPPFRSNSVGLLQKPASALLAQTTTDGSVPHLVMRSHSMSSNSGSSSTKPGHPLPQKGCLGGSSLVPTQLWIPRQVVSHHHCPTTNSSGLSGATSNSNRTYTSTKTVLTDSKYTAEDLLPAYDNLANNPWDTSNVDKQNNDV